MTILFEKYKYSKTVNDIELTYVLNDILRLISTPSNSYKKLNKSHNRHAIPKILNFILLLKIIKNKMFFTTQYQHKNISYKLYQICLRYLYE